MSNPYSDFENPSATLGLGNKQKLRSYNRLKENDPGWVEWLQKRRDKHRATSREWSRKKRLNNPETLIERQLRHKKHQRKLKITVLNGYGGKCECCGINEIEFLTIDHIKGGGRDHVKELGGQPKFYPWLIKNDFPKGFRVLCMNCNFAIRLGN